MQKSVPFPRIVVLCQQYHFQPKEADLFHLMVVAQGSNNPAVLNTMLEEDYLRKMSGFKRVSGMADVDVDLFCDADRAHMKENIVAVVSIPSPFRHPRLTLCLYRMKRMAFSLICVFRM